MDIHEHQPSRGLTFEDILTMFRETDRRFKETDRQFKEIALQSKETDRRMAETDRRMAETDRRMAETDRQFRETDRKISKLGSRIGELIENLVASNLLQKFNDQGFLFTKTATNVQITNPGHTFQAEIDILLENGTTALAVEVKSKLTADDVKEHLDRMEKLRRHADEHGDRRKFLGAVAGGIIPGNVKSFAIEKGFFVIEQSGDTAVLAVPEG
ncbi:MAG: hypothetical protein LBD78_10015, partial [Spirochaetaceae bacterium]|nr:hypothetical protein [Spirochaetaceae bacterium]